MGYGATCVMNRGDHRNAIIEDEEGFTCRVSSEILAKSSLFSTSFVSFG